MTQDPVERDAITSDRIWASGYAAGRVSAYRDTQSDDLAQALFENRIYSRSDLEMALTPMPCHSVRCRCRAPGHEDCCGARP